MAKKWLTTQYPEIIFEDNEVGRMKKEIFDAGEKEIDAILADYDIPSPSEYGVAGTYIQNTPRAHAIEKRKNNDIIFIPIGCTENHGLHQNTGLDTFMVTQLLEGVRRYTKKQGHETNLTFTPLNFGGHPHHHLGMPGTVIVPQEVVQEMLIYVLAGLWDDGYRKMVLVNNHGHLWMLVSAIQEFMKRFQLPAVVQVVDWHRAVREFFMVTDKVPTRWSPTSYTPPRRKPPLRNFSFRTWSTWPTSRMHLPRAFSPTATSTSPSIPTDAHIGGPRGRGTLPLSARPLPRASSVRRARRGRKRRSDR